MTAAHQQIRLLRVNDLPWSADWSTVFGTEPDRPLILEIGFGYGQMLRHLSKTRPDANILGVEISNVCLVKAEGAIARGELPNVRVMFAMAETALHHLFAPQSIHEIHINFPDPWFKNRHEHRRLMQRETVDVMVSRLLPGARLYLATDILEYAEMSAELLADTPGLSNILDAPWVNSLPGRAATKYETRARQEGRICYYFVYERNSQSAPAIPVMEDAPMPHIVFSSPLSLQDIESHFAPTEYTERRTHVNYINLYLSNKVGLFEVFIDEPTIEQRVALILVKRDSATDEYTLQMGSIGSPRPTQGMHVAVRHLADWIVQLHPESKIVQSKLRQD
ncbi:MAG TPA: tRNA (guanosine(46)-N7)-methyltransferase TrmB [Phototrophicaceae bacterium]|nr:tRNA (guanosine(46)-N7)-methyltransferase TrmB [Phototrophicaceae bacterium]